MMQASVYGRLGRDPQTRQTKTGADMVTCSIAVDAAPGNSEQPETVWFQVLAFGKVAETLARHQKGDLVSLSGRITQSRWTNQAAEEKTGMTIITDAVISAKSVRPSGGRKKEDGTAGDYDDCNDEFTDEIRF